MAKQLKIRVFPDGHIESETVGIKGKECLNHLKDMENITGAEIVNSEFTEDYNAVAGQFYTSEEVYELGD